MTAPVIRATATPRPAWISRLLVAAAILAIPLFSAMAEPPAAADEAAIRGRAAAYRAALAKGDSAAVKAFWTADGDIVDGWGGRLGPEEVAPAGGAAEAAEQPRFVQGPTTIRFLSADVAIEDGTVAVVLPGTSTPIEGSFSAIWVRRDGVWKLASLRESERPVAADADMLDDLDWLVGDWELAVEGSPPMTMRVRWDAGRAFLIRDARVPVAGSRDAGDAVEVHQRIGWDPTVRRIRSWSFSSDGSRGEATWFRDGSAWIATHTAISPSGRQETAVNIYRYDGRDRCGWQVLGEAMESGDGAPSEATWVRTKRPAQGGTR